MLEIGTKAPDFTLPNKEGQNIQFYELLAKGPAVLYFYPKNETPGCTKEACAFRDQYEDFKDTGAEVVGVSADSTTSHLKFANNRRLPFVLLSDPEHRVHKQYGVSSSFFGLFSQRITYVIDQDGTVQHAFKSQLAINKHIDQALATLRSLAAKAQ